MKYFINVKVLACLLLSRPICSSIDWNSTLQTITNYFDEIHPPYPPSVSYKQPDVNPIIFHNYHPKRCTSIENNDAKRHFLQGDYRSITQKQFKSEQFAILISTPCLGSDSLGNGLGAYFENIVCAKKAGLHYLAVSRIWEPKTFHETNPFLSSLPGVIPHNYPVGIIEAKTNIQNICICPGSCHERVKALWHSKDGLNMIKPILKQALQSHLLFLKKENQAKTVIVSSDLTNIPIGTLLPLVPEAAIHYRCGDNFVGHYGFLPFRAFINTIPSTVKSIFVLAENRNRKTINKRHLATKCDAIFQSLFEFLRKHFPDANVLIRRGDNLYTDMFRLSYANTTICSVSTFCIWPAIVNSGVAYFPKTRLVVSGDTNIDMGFKWITSPSIISGAQNEPSPIKSLLNKLNV
eukprot:gene7301-9948_t